jgi:hypothetical protein
MTGPNVSTPTNPSMSVRCRMTVVKVRVSMYLTPAIYTMVVGITIKCMASVSTYIRTGSYMKVNSNKA